MALVIHQVQGSYATSRLESWKRGIESKQSFVAFPTVERTARFISLKCKSCLCVGAPLIIGSNGKSLRIISFKGSVQNDESGGKASGSKSVKNSVKLSYLSQESEETSTHAPKVQNAHVSSTSEADESIAGSVAIQNLFRSWLTLLRTPLPNHVADETLEGPSPEGISETQNGAQTSRRSEILKAVWCSFLGLDATIKIPLMIFIPMYLAVTLKYGTEVSKELTPLWIAGPLITALYVKMLRGICSLYVFCFKQTVRVVKNLPTYYLVAYDYLVRGKLKEIIRAHLWQPLVDIRNLDYKEVAKRIMKDLEGWLVDKYLDFVESIWPYYCRTIRFLKRANLI